MKLKMQKFLYGRYGTDALNRTITIVVLILYLLSLLFGWTLLYALTPLLLVVSIYRMLSRNIQKRAAENMAYYRLRQRVKLFFTLRMDHVRQRKTHRFYACPTCKQKVRVPKGRGSVAIHCPKCGADFIRKS